MEATGAGFANTWKAQASCHDKLDWLDDPCSLNIESGEARPRGVCGGGGAGGGRWPLAPLLPSATWLVDGGPRWLPARRPSKGARPAPPSLGGGPRPGADAVPCHLPCQGRLWEGWWWRPRLPRAVVLPWREGPRATRQRGSGDELEGAAPAEVLTPPPANYAEHWCSLLKKTETPFGRCHSAVDPSDYYKVRGLRTCTTRHLTGPAQCAVCPGLGLTPACKACPCVCACVCLPVTREGPSVCECARVLLRVHVCVRLCVHVGVCPPASPRHGLPPPPPEVQI